MQPPLAWWNCLPAPERGAIVGIAPLLQPPVWSTACAFVELAFTAAALSPSRQTAFCSIFHMVRVEGLPLPPPADCVYLFDAAIWEPILIYLDLAGSGYDMCLCDPLRQAGQQGGAWPTCWP